MSSAAGQLPRQVPPEEDHRVALEAVWWTFFSIATIFIGLRFWARIIHRSLGLDDFVMALCYVSKHSRFLYGFLADRLLCNRSNLIAHIRFSSWQMPYCVWVDHLTSLVVGHS